MSSNFLNSIKNDLKVSLFTDDDLKLVFRDTHPSAIYNSLTYHLKKKNLERYRRGPWRGKDIRVDEKFLKDALSEKINSLNWDEVKADVRKFLPSEKAQSLNIWSSEFFKSKVEKLNVSGS